METDKLIGKWNYAHAGTIISALAASLLLDNLNILMSAAAVSFLVFILLNLKSLKEMKPFGGYANRVTLIRVLLTILLGFFWFHLSDYQIVFLAIIIVALDGLDGYLARRFNQQSVFGAYFDIETDAFYVALLSLIIYKREYFSFWILIPGFLRYFYVLVIRFLHFHRFKEKRLRFTQVIAVIYFISLLSPFLLPHKIFFPLLVISSALIVISFFYSFYIILNQRIHED